MAAAEQDWERTPARAPKVGAGWRARSPRRVRPTPARSRRHAAEPKVAAAAPAAAPVVVESAKPNDSLAREVPLIDAGRADLATAPSRALAVLETHRREFPHGQLAAEREFLAVQALLQMNHMVDAKKRAEELAVHYPSSSYAARAARLIEDAEAQRAAAPAKDGSHGQRAGPACSAIKTACRPRTLDVSQRRLWLWVLCAGLAVSVGACGARRELIASQGPNAVPFSFPYVDPAIPDAPGQFGGARRRSDGRAAHRLSARRRDARARTSAQITFQWTRGDDANRVFRIRLDDGHDALRLLRPLHAGDLPLPDARARLAGDRLRAPRRHAAGDDRRHRRRGRLGLSIAGDRRALLARAGDGRPLLLDRDQHGRADGRHDVPPAVRRLASVALHRAVVADQPAGVRRLPQRQPRRPHDLVLVDGRSRFAGRVPGGGAHDGAGGAQHRPQHGIGHTDRDRGALHRAEHRRQPRAR